MTHEEFCMLNFENTLRWLFHLPYRSIGDQTGSGSRLQTITPTVIQTWEENRFGRRHRSSIEAFRKRNPDLSFLLYDSSMRDAYMNKFWFNHKILDLYQRSAFGPMRADIFRYCIVYDLGGYYFDISKGISAKITDLHSATAREFLSFEKNSVPASWTHNSKLDLIRPNNLLIQWGFGFEPKHEILRILIQQICSESEKFEKKYFSNPKAAILELTGPIAFTRAVWKYMGEFDGRLCTLDLDFNGLGIYAMKGAGARHLKFPSYAQATNMMILNDAWNKE